VWVDAPAEDAITARLKEMGTDDDQVQEILKATTENAEHSKTPEFYSKALPCDEDSALKELEWFIFGPAEPKDDDTEVNGEVKEGSLEEKAVDENGPQDKATEENDPQEKAPDDVTMEDTPNEPGDSA
jgi:hypothetical protein